MRARRSAPARVASRGPRGSGSPRARCDGPRARRRPGWATLRRWTATRRTGRGCSIGGRDGRRDRRLTAVRARDWRVVAADRAVRGRRAVGGDRRGPRRVGPGGPARRAPRRPSRRSRRSAGGPPPSSGSTRPRRAGARLFEVIDARPEVVDPPAPASPPRDSDSRSTASGSGTRAGRATSSTACRYRSRQAGGSPLSDPAGPASPPWSSSSSASTTTRPARSGSAAASCAGWRRTRSGRGSPSSPSASTCSTRRSATTSRWPTPT